MFFCGTYHVLRPATAASLTAPTTVTSVPRVTRGGRTRCASPTRLLVGGLLLLLLLLYCYCYFIATTTTIPPNDTRLLVGRFYCFCYFTTVELVVKSFSSRLPWRGTVNQLLGCLKVSGRWFMSQAEQNLVKLTYFQCGGFQTRSQEPELRPASTTSH